MRESCRCSSSKGWHFDKWYLVDNAHTAAGMLTKPARGKQEIKRDCEKGDGYELVSRDCQSVM